MLLGEELQIVKIGDEGQNNLRTFPGSPTIVLDGKDIYTGLPPQGRTLSCRSYVINGKRA